MLSCLVMSDSFATPWTVPHPTLLSAGFSRQEYWNGLSFPPLGDLPDPGIEPEFPALAGRLFTTVPPGKPLKKRIPGGSAVKNPPGMRETWVRYLGWEDPLEEGMATHSNILAWRIPWTEEARGLQSMGLQRAGHN